jgi:hypothetical protein
MYVTEFHYRDGDVGAYEDVDVFELWKQFTKNHEPSHIVVRPDTEQGQQLSNGLHNAAKMAAALKALVDSINATGGVVRSASGPAPVGDAEWLDLGLAYTLACDALGVGPMIAD